MTTAIVLAGGLGTRLRSVVPDLPKPMAPVAGRPFLEHLLTHWIGQGVRRFVLSVGYRHEAIVGHFGGALHGVPIDYAIETSPLGTGGALLRAASMLERDRRFLLLNGDTWFEVPLARLAANAAARDADWCFALFRTDERGRYMGPALAPDGRIVALRGDETSAGRAANGGVYLVHPRSLRTIAGSGDAPMSLESDLMPAWLADGARMHGVCFDAPFIDIGVPDDFRRAASVIAPADVELARVPAHG